MRKIKIIKICLFQASFFCGLSTWSFQLPEHVEMTNQALAQMERCFAGFFSDQDKKVIVQANLGEDLNVVRKDFVYSHFYNPTKSIAMWRHNSMVRVLSIQEILEENSRLVLQSRKTQLIHLGHAIHHIQDMAVPAHVVPIMHTSQDGFEKWKLPMTYFKDQNSFFDCSEMQNLKKVSLHEILFLAARRTVSAIQNLKFTLASGQVLDGQAFWQFSTERSFGRYGMLGNSFGRPDKFSRKFFDQFKGAQWHSAVAGTLSALLYFKDRSETEEAFGSLGSGFGSLGIHERSFRDAPGGEADFDSNEFLKSSEPLFAVPQTSPSSP